MNDEKVRVAIYIRVSVIHQIDKDSLPMQQKRDRLKTFIFKQSCNILCQITSIASPNEKKRYLCFTASAYPAKTNSRPANALTSIIKLDLGR